MDSIDSRMRPVMGLIGGERGVPRTILGTKFLQGSRSNVIAIKCLSTAIFIAAARLQPHYYHPLPLHCHLSINAAASEFCKPSDNPCTLLPLLCRLLVSYKLLLVTPLLESFCFLPCLLRGWATFTVTIKTIILVQHSRVARVRDCDFLTFLDIGGSGGNQHSCLRVPHVVARGH